MAVYRCAACGSPNVVTDRQAGGITYNYKKGAVGSVVLGAGGAAAGIENKIQTVYKCSDCGMVLSYPMDAETKNVIDLGVRVAEARDKLKLYGVDVSWDFLKGKYKNIEEGTADEIIRMRQETNARIHKSMTDYVADVVLEKLFEINADLAAYEKGIDDYEELHREWAESAKHVMADREKALAAAVVSLDADIDRKLEHAKASAMAVNRKLKTEEHKLNEEKAMLSEKLPTLGVLKFAEKKATQTRLEEIEAEFAELDRKYADLTSTFQKEVEKLKTFYIAQKKKLSADVEEKYPLAEDPMKKKARIENIQTWFESIRTATYNIEHLLGEVTTYAIILVMKDFSNGKAMYVSHGEPSDWENGKFNGDDADPIFKKVLPELLKMFNLEMTGGRGLFRQRLYAILLTSLPERGLTEIVQDGYTRTYVVK